MRSFYVFLCVLALAMFPTSVVSPGGFGEFIGRFNPVNWFGSKKQPQQQQQQQENSLLSNPINSSPLNLEDDIECSVEADHVREAFLQAKPFFQQALKASSTVGFFTPQNQRIELYKAAKYSLFQAVMRYEAIRVSGDHPKLLKYLLKKHEKIVTLLKLVESIEKKEKKNSYWARFLNNFQRKPSGQEQNELNATSEEIRMYVSMGSRQDLFEEQQLNSESQTCNLKKKKKTGTKSENTL